MELIDKLVNIKYAIIYIDSEEKALDFYIDLLGFQLADHFKNDEEDWWILNKPNNQNFSLILIKDNKERAFDNSLKKNTLIINTQDCLFEYSKLVSLGLECEYQPSYNPIGLSVSFYDPFMNRIIFLEERNYTDFN